ncbi:GTP pyrophosphokinase family protein [Cytobacillus sp. IB215665]|uniref:GTP pyrophosphokinase n=1 Tax=Cytobacillus sp. IB215665 TaxID=3097357 RepID=UPI002A0D3050|nr:GTP pyrophosphokinase family protein [Cytobacillus sp. IB215665]MDX8365877.1 GTP pyrophosphokinase family protein [Cytobacillus sp. IB215665]
MDAKSQNNIEQMRSFKKDLIRFMMSYKFALAEVNTKIDILKQEFQYIHDYNPIEHTNSRLKSPESILRKIDRKGIGLSLPYIRENIKDIAGIRITCSFISDIYKIKDMLEQQKDITVIECKDYIEYPKPNGYQSLHLIIQIPIFMSDREDLVPVEIQIRTIAMDFWASLEHKIYYKYNKEIPERIKNELKEAADTAAKLDKKMEDLHKEMNQIKQLSQHEDILGEQLANNDTFKLIPAMFMSEFNKNNKK